MVLAIYCEPQKTLRKQSQNRESNRQGLLMLASAIDFTKKKPYGIKNHNNGKRTNQRKLIPNNWILGVITV